MVGTAGGIMIKAPIRILFKLVVVLTPMAACWAALVFAFACKAKWCSKPFRRTLISASNETVYRLVRE
jgi:hypothetical protein